MAQPLTIKVATDLYGAKVNYMIDFSALPTLSALKMKVESTFTKECEARRPADAPLELFRIDHIQVFDGDTGTWRELDSNALLAHGCQLYIFQPPSNWHNDMQSGLPPAVRPPLHMSVERVSPPPLSGYHASPNRHTAPVVPAHASVTRIAYSPLVPSPLAVHDHHLNAGLAHAHAAHAAHAAQVENGHAMAHAAAMAEQEMAAQGHQLHLQEAKAAEAAHHAGIIAAQLSELQRGTVAAKEGFAHAAANVDAAKSSERASQAEHMKQLDLVRSADAKVHVAESELMAADTRLGEIARLIRDHRMAADALRDKHMKAVIDAETATHRLFQAEEAVGAASTAVEDCERAIATATHEHETAVEKVAAAEEAIAETKEASKLRKLDVDGALTAIHAAKEVEQLKRHEQGETQRQVGVAQVRVMAQEEEAVKTELRLKEVEGLYKMQELEVERHRELCDRSKNDLQAAKDREEEAGNAALEAQRAVHRAEDDLMAAEVEYEKALSAEREAQAQLLMANAEVERTKASVAAREHALDRIKERLNHLKRAFDEAKAASTTADARKTALVADMEAAEKRLEELERLYHEQVLAVEKGRIDAAEARQLLAEKAARERETHAQVQVASNMVVAAQDNLMRKQHELATSHNIESELAGAKLAADGERAVQETLRAVSEKQLTDLREHSIRRAVEEDAIRTADMQSHIARSIQAENYEAAARRLALEHELARTPLRGPSASYIGTA